MSKHLTHNSVMSSSSTLLMSSDAGVIATLGVPPTPSFNSVCRLDSSAAKESSQPDSSQSFTSESTASTRTLRKLAVSQALEM